MGVAELKPESCLAVKGEGFKGTPRGENFKGVNRTPGGNTRGAVPLSGKQYDRKVCDLCVTECPIGAHSFSGINPINCCLLLNVQ